MRFFNHSRALLFVVGLLALPPQAGAQLPKLPGNSSATAAPVAGAAAGETSEGAEARLELWLKEARAAFARINEAGADVALPAGVTAAELSDYRRDLEQIGLGIVRNQKTLDAVPDARKALEAARAEAADWNGFAEKPPYPVLMIDELRNQQDALREKAASYQSSLDHFGSTLAGLQDEGRAAEESTRRVSAEAAEDPSEDGAAKWRLAADLAKSRLLVVRATFLQGNIALLRDQAEAAKIQLGLLARKVRTARENAEFTDEQLAKVTETAAKRQAKLRKEIATTNKRNQEATVAKARMQVVVDKLEKDTPPGTPIEKTPELALARVKMESTETRVDSYQHILETLESLDQLESYMPDSYKNRQTLMRSTDKVARAAALKELRAVSVRLTAWETLIANDLAAVNADIRNQESRANGLPADDPRLVPLSDVRVALWDKQAVIQRVALVVSAQRWLLARWLDDFAQEDDAKPLKEKFADAAQWSWDYLRKLWDFEVFQYDDTVMAAGVPITEKRSVTLGKFFIAIALFLAGYFISGRIKNRLGKVAVGRGHIAEAQARTLGNWLMIVVAFLLAVGTLHFLRIPLTVFAFFGGAMAIGLGFGTQTLIKNFISGIIVLFERKIRVGDVVDTGETVGTVIEVNTRSSVLRGRDGRESLVPNSVFLENTITNLTLSDRFTRRFINIGVAYGTSSQQVMGILSECAERHGLVEAHPEPVVLLQDFGENSVLFKLYFWMHLDGNKSGEQVESDLRLMIEKRFGEVGIQFPFPQRDMHLFSEKPLQVEWTAKTEPKPDPYQ